MSYLNYFELKPIEEKKYTEFLFIILLFYKYIVNAFNLTVRYFLGNVYKLDTVFIYTIFVIIALLSIKDICKNIRIQHFLFVFFITIIIYASYLTVNNIETNKEVVRAIYLTCIPAFIISSQVLYYEKIWIYMKYGSYFSIVSIAYLIFVLKEVNYITVVVYSQSKAYQLLLPCAILLVALFKKANFLDFIILLVGLFIMSMYGARGPILCISVLLFILIIRFINKSDYVNKYVFISLFFGGFMWVVLSLKNIVGYLYTMFIKYSMSTRVLERFMSNTFFEDIARRDLIEASLESIKLNLFFGVGAINDRQVLHRKVLPNQDAIGAYPHNIILEILMQFGVVFGTILIIALIVLLLKTLKHIKNNDCIFFFLVFLTIGIMPLFVSGSYIDYPSFYILIGFCFSVVFKSHNTNKDFSK